MVNRQQRRVGDQEAGAMKKLVTYVGVPLVAFVSSFYVPWYLNTTDVIPYQPGLFTTLWFYFMGMILYGVLVHKFAGTPENFEEYGGI